MKLVKVTLLMTSLTQSFDSKIFVGWFRPKLCRIWGVITCFSLPGYDFRGHTRGTLVVGIAYGYPYYKNSAIFSLVFLSNTSEKSFIP